MAQEVMRLVPTGVTLEVEGLVLNKDIGRVEEGQDVTLKAETFDFTKYGTIDGSVRKISADAVEDETLGWIYPARFTMAAATMNIDGKDIHLSPGMTITAEVKTGTRKIIEYLLARLKRYQDESLREQ